MSSDILDPGALLQLEAPVWELHRNKRRQKIIKNAANVAIKIKKLISIMDYEKAKLNKPPKLDVSRRVHEQYLADLRKRIEEYKCIHSALLLCNEEAHIKSYYYHHSKALVTSKTIRCLQWLEANSNSQLDKVKQRLNPFEQTVVDALHLRHVSESGIAIGKYLWDQSKEIARVIGGKPLTEIKSPGSTCLVMIVICLQRIEFTCIRCNIAKDTERVIQCAQLTGNIILLLRSWPDPSEIPILLLQAIRTLRSILDSEIAAQRLIHNSSIRRLWSWGRASDRRLVEELTYWIDLIIPLRTGGPPFPSRTEEDLIMIVSATRLVSDLLYCSRCLLLLVTEACPDNDRPTYQEESPSPCSSTRSSLQESTLGDEADSVFHLLTSSLQLGVIVSNQYHLLVTDQSSRSLSDSRMIEGREREIIGALDIAETAFSIGYCLSASVTILQCGKHCVEAQRLSLPLVYSWVCLLSSASLLAVTARERKKDSPRSVKMQFNGSDSSIQGVNYSEPMSELVSYLGSCLSVVVYGMAVHKHSAILYQRSLLVLRACLRKPFLKRKDVDNMFTDIDEDDEHVSPQDATPKEHVFTTEDLFNIFYEFDMDNVSSMMNTSNDSMTMKSSGHNNNNMSTCIDSHNAVAAALKQKKKTKSVEASLPSVLSECGPLHVQSSEVQEQWLLLLYHLCSSSYFAKLALLEAGVLESVKRVQTLRAGSNSPYLMALFELCFELMSVEDAV